MSKINDTWEALIHRFRYSLNMVEGPDGNFRNAQGNADGHAKVEVSGGTVATQTTLAAVLAALATPPTHTAITASDATDLTSIANFGVYIGGAGNLVYRTVGAPSTTVTLAVVAGQLVYGQFTRVMAATTATGIVGVAR